MRPDNFKTNIDPCDLREAYERLYLLTNEINTIEVQLQDSGRSKNFPSFNDYKHWRQKANIAMGMKLKQVESLKKWIQNNNGELPNEEHDNAKPENMSLSNNPRLNTEKRPDPDKIIDNLCGSIMQMRALKRRLYPFYKIANAAFDLAQELGIENDDPQDVLNQMIYWLDKAGYDIQEIPGYFKDHHSFDADYDDYDDFVEDEE